jgi:hypothetical protein
MAVILQGYTKLQHIAYTVCIAAIDPGQGFVRLHHRPTYGV